MIYYEADFSAAAASSFLYLEYKSTFNILLMSSFFSLRILACNNGRQTPANTCQLPIRTYNSIFDYYINHHIFWGFFFKAGLTFRMPL